MGESSQSTPARTPDAIQFPAGWVDPKLNPGQSRVDHLLNSFEPILGGGYAKGRPGFIRELAGSQFRFVSLDPEATLLYPSDHPLEKRPRYDWTDQPNGLKYGFLRPDDQAAAQPSAAQLTAMAQQQLAATTAMAQFRARFARWKELAYKEDRSEAETTELEALDKDLGKDTPPGNPEAL